MKTIPSFAASLARRMMMMMTTIIKTVVMGQARCSCQMYEGQRRSSPVQLESLLESRAPHSGDWLFTLPISVCGLRLDDEAIRVAVALRLGIHLGTAHVCRCWANVDPSGVHSLVYRHAPSGATKHIALNDCIFGALQAARIPASKELSGLVPLMVGGQTVTLSSNGAVASTSHGILRQPEQWQIPIHRLLPENPVQSPSGRLENRQNTVC